MSDDFLERAKRALAGSGDPSAEQLARARSRVLADVRRTRRRRGGFFYVAFPIAAVLAFGVAWAAQSGQLLTLLRGTPVHSVAAPVSAAPVGSPRAAPALASVASASTESSSSEPSSAESSSALAASSPSASSPGALSASPRPPSPSVALSPSSAPAASVGSADLAAYRRAHQLHFVEADHAAALPAWNAYLQQFPSGAFAVEARYNRAICFVKLGRKSEAKIALTPFAEGKVAGGYRRDQAKALLDAL